MAMATRKARPILRGLPGAEGTWVNTASPSMKRFLRLVFAKFAELQSVRQVHVWLREEGIYAGIQAFGIEHGCQHH
jgi:hypothetical protein